MASQIRMTPETMRTRASEYTTQANNLQTVITKMDALLQTLQGEWEGNASEAYAARFAELRPGFVKAKDLIDEISAALKKTAQMVEATDNSIANQFRS
ncbi:MAG: WXG100 family type VII secretion target [Lachnospiraceae bacterium]|nr:WXG100 family type VII secretion target [Lachnospiraceae bacterium]